MLRTGERRNIITASLQTEISARTVLVRGRNTRDYSWLHLVFFWMRGLGVPTPFVRFSSFVVVTDPEKTGD